MAQSSDSLEQVVRETLEAAAGTAALLSASRKVIAPRLTYLITEHAQQGRFLGGGDHEGSSYSENTLPAFYLGKLQKSSGGRWQLQSDALNKTVTPNKGSLIWRTGDDGRANAYLLGGYKEFRRLAGRSTDFVNLTFTGRMLGSVTSTARVKRGGVEIKTGATGGQQDKAAYTNEMYEWLGLHDDEQRDVREKLEDFIDDLLGGRPNVTIKKPAG